MEQELLRSLQLRMFLILAEGLGHHPMPYLLDIADTTARMSFHFGKTFSSLVRCFLMSAPNAHDLSKFLQHIEGKRCGDALGACFVAWSSSSPLHCAVVVITAAIAHPSGATGDGTRAQALALQCVLGRRGIDRPTDRASCLHFIGSKKLKRAFHPAFAGSRLKMMQDPQASGKPTQTPIAPFRLPHGIMYGTEQMQSRCFNRRRIDTW
jgi:hypothetical protein